MILKQFVEKLQLMLTNPNAIALESNIVYIFTNDCELLAVTF